ncbi:MAG TPA: CocE/NonD family hydrolase [Kiloniellales bacterium]|nr:CocE/NonD family hydrolase [Kiloniellales bacterium]
MTVVERFPHEVETRDPVFIALPDGTRLAATLWLPRSARPVPAILEFLPYRRRDGTVFRDRQMAPYLAGHGFAYARVDIRGSGDSEGVLTDEYTPQEQEDACAVIAWLAAQPWCSGRVGMTGISWGGFNALQVAARRPAGLAAVIALCCADDRFAIDVHYMGGAYLTEDPLWSSFMLAVLALPPDPVIVGERWQRMWCDRLEALDCWSARWLEHQARDDYWRQGSVCEDFARIAVPVYAVGGWDDGYVEAVLRLLAGLKAPCKGLIGPWSHHFPCLGSPGPLIGWLQEALRWWRRWLLDEPNGIDEEPRLTAWLREPEPAQPRYDEHPGRWVTEPAWPSPAIEARRLWLNAGALGASPVPGATLSIASPVTAGADCGRWSGYGGAAAELAVDQRREDAHALAFDTAPLAQDLEFLGTPVVELQGRLDAPRGNVTARLCDVAPDGSSTLITWGTLNLAHRGGEPCDLAPGDVFAARITLRAAGRRVPKGHRLRLALATQHWPVLWPQPFRATLSLASGASSLVLPIRTPRQDRPPAFARPETAPPLPATEHRPARFDKVWRHEIASGRHRLEIRSDYGRWHLPESGIVTDSAALERYTIVEDDPLSANVEGRWFIALQSGPADVQVDSSVQLCADATDFRLAWTVETRQRGAVVGGCQGERLIRRRHV